MVGRNESDWLSFSGWFTGSFPNEFLERRIRLVLTTEVERMNLVD